MAAMAVNSVSSALGRLSVSGFVSSSTCATPNVQSKSFPSASLSISSSSFHGASLTGFRVHRPSVARAPHLLVVAADKEEKKAVVKKKVDSAVKRAKQSEVRRIYHKSRKTEMSTRMKKVFLALEALKKADAPSEADLLPVEKLISEAYKIIDKSAKVGTIHPNKAAHRKSRLARAKRAVVMAFGWYTPAPAPAVASAIAA